MAQGGTVDFRTYLDKSGSRQGGQVALGAEQPQGMRWLQEPHIGVPVPSSNPSRVPFNNIPTIIPTTRIPTKWIMDSFIPLMDRADNLCSINNLNADSEGRL